MEVTEFITIKDSNKNIIVIFIICKCDEEEKWLKF